MTRRFLFSLSISLTIHFFGVVGFKSFFYSPQKKNFSNLKRSHGIKVSIRLARPKKFEKVNKHKKGTFKDQQKSQKLTSSSKSKKSGGDLKAMSKYLKSIRDLIDKSKFKSKIASRLKLHDTIRVGFVVYRDQKIRDIEVLKKSSHLQLNLSAIKTLKDIESIPAFPSEIKRDKIPLEIDISY